MSSRGGSAGLRFAVLGTGESWYFHDLARAAQHLGAEAIAVPFTELRASLTPSQRGLAAVSLRAAEHDLRSFDAVLVRTMPPGSLEQVVFRMDALHRLAAAGVTIVNSPRAVEIAVDKYLTSALLHEAGFATPRTIVCQTSHDALAAFAELGGDVVLKPIFGSEGRGITRLQDEALAVRAFRMLEQLGAVFYLQEFVAHEGYDMRLLVVGERVLGVRRRNPFDWRTNCSRGAVAEPFDLPDSLAADARRAAAAVGASIAGVDFLPARDGKLYAIEVNAVPGWKATAAALQTDVAALVLEHAAHLAAARRAAGDGGGEESSR